MSIGAGTAFVGGLLTFASPCVLPLIPVYLSVLVGGSIDEVAGAKRRFKLLVNGTLFVLGFLSVFVLLGLGASAFGKFLVQYRLVFQQLGGMMVFFFGLKFLGVANLSVLDREKRFNFGGSGRISPLGAVAIGITFAFGWTPCIGPILGSILTLAAISTDSLAGGAWLLLLYGLGLGVPLLVVALFAQQGVSVLRKLHRLIPRLEKATGAVLVIVSILMVTDSLGIMTLAAGDASSAEISKELVVKVKRDAESSFTGRTDAVQDEGAALTDGQGEECTGDSASCALAPEDVQLEVAVSLDALIAGPVVLDFYRPDCPACLKMVPIIQTLKHACSGRGLRIEEIDLSETANRGIALEMRVVGTPTLLFFDEDGNEVARLVGTQTFDSVHQAIAVLMGEKCAGFSEL